MQHFLLPALYIYQRPFIFNCLPDYLQLDFYATHTPYIFHLQEVIL